MTFNRVPSLSRSQLFWWLAWLGCTDLTDFSLSSICDKVFNVLEEKFGQHVVSHLISLIIAARDGLTETELIELLHQSRLVTGSVPKIWLQFCWLMSHGPMLRQNNHIKLMDSKLSSVAGKRYASNVKIAHRLLYDFYSGQPDTFTPSDDSVKYRSINHNKFIELPYHAYILEQTPSNFTESIYLSDLNWIQTKLKTTKCVQFILNDIYLVDASARSAAKHLGALIEFLEINKQPINYDAKQFYPLLKHYIRKKSTDGSELERNPIVKHWIAAFNSIPISYLDIVDNNNVEESVATDSRAIGYDFITNLGGGEHFVASLNTQREEICVWDVPR